VCPQHDLTLILRNFSETVLRPQRALEFLHGQDPKRTFVERSVGFPFGRIKFATP
jgi:hypothetical protein